MKNLLCQILKSGVRSTHLPLPRYERQILRSDWPLCLSDVHLVYLICISCHLRAHSDRSHYIKIYSLGNVVKAKPYEWHFSLHSFQALYIYIYFFFQIKITKTIPAVCIANKNTILVHYPMQILNLDITMALRCLDNYYYYWTHIEVLWSSLHLSSLKP